MKYKLTGTVSNRLDVCSLCDEAWLDGGEWELLEALHLSHLMPAIFTDEWQRRIRRELVEGTRRQVLARMIGEEGVNKVEEFKGVARPARAQARHHGVPLQGLNRPAIAASGSAARNGRAAGAGLMPQDDAPHETCRVAPGCAVHFFSRVLE